MIIRLIANATSPHVRSWVRALKPIFQISLYDINSHRNDLVSDIEEEVVKPLSGRVPQRFKLLQYVMLGLWLRMQDLSGLLHAHNTSGYGLAAWLSGKKYIVTTYGTEIYQAPQRGRLYRWLIRHILGRSAMVTASTPFMAATLENKFSVPSSKIFCRMLVDQVFIDAGVTAKQPAPRTWLVNRRMTKLYCTVEVIAAFKRFLDMGGQGHLVVLEGDSDEAYAKRVVEAASGNPHIRLIRGFVEQSALIKELQTAHFVVSVPESDQLSSSIVEAAACQAVPIIRNLESYEPIKSICITVDDSRDLVQGLTEAFQITANMPDKELKTRGVRAREFVLDVFSPNLFRAEFARRVYELS